MSNQPQGPFLFDPLPDDPQEEEEPKPGRPDREPPQGDEPERRREDLSPASNLPQSGGPPPPLREADRHGDVDVDSTAPEAAVAPTPGRRPQQVLFEEPAEDRAEEEVAAAASRGRRRQIDPERVGPLARLTSGLIDLAALLAVALIALLVARLLGIEAGLHLLPGVVLFVVIFSFAYHIFSLLFWGRTPGMALADLVARDPSGKSLTAWQSTLRWAGSLGTVLLAGIPMLVSWFTGWSLADLVSGSETKVDSV